MRIKKTANMRGFHFDVLTGVLMCFVLLLAYPASSQDCSDSITYHSPIGYEVKFSVKDTADLNQVRDYEERMLSSSPFDSIITPEFHANFADILKARCQGDYNKYLGRLAFIASHFLSGIKADEELMIIQYGIGITDAGFKYLLEWYEQNRNAFTLERFRQIYRLNTMSAHLNYILDDTYKPYYYDMSNIISAKYDERIDSIINVIEKESTYKNRKQ